LHGDSIHASVAYWYATVAIIVSVAVPFQLPLRVERRKYINATVLMFSLTFAPSKVDSQAPTRVREGRKKERKKKKEKVGHL
jgi:hypothetical protein